jgi:phage N-6-adenine-methyltransferase
MAEIPDSTATVTRMDWETPPELFAVLDAEFGFDLDVCANKSNSKCKRFYSEQDDGLSKDWTGTCWMNPPYGRGVIDKWLKKASESPGAIVVALIPSRTGPPWWHRYVMERADEIRFLRGKLKFVGASSVAGFCSAVVVYRNQDNLAHPGQEEKKP